MHAFIEAAFDDTPALPAAGNAWNDRSTADYFIFASVFGSVRLRRRTAYPRTFAAVNGSRLFFGYGPLGTAAAVMRKPLDEIADVQYYDDEFLLVEVDIHTRRVRVQRDACSTLPLFACLQQSRLVLSDRFERACMLADVAQLRLDRIALAELLCSLPTYDRTLCDTIKLLYDRTRLLWTPRGYTVLRPPHARPAQEGASDIRQLGAWLEGTIDHYYRRYAGEGSVACQLSGGMDSALVAGYLHDKGYDPVTVSMLFPGAAGTTQRRKLQALHHRLPLRSMAFPLDSSNDYPLLAALSASGRPAYHYQLTAHTAAEDTLLARLQAAGIECLFTGHGGDELCEHLPDRTHDIREDMHALFELRKEGAEPWLTPTFHDFFRDCARAARDAAPRALPLVSASMANCYANGSGHTFSRNIWPVSPLAHPALYAYCQGLPIRYRHNRNLSRMYLRARRLPAIVYDNSSEEYFSEHYFYAVVKNLGGPLRAYMDRSVLARYQLIDKNGLLRSFEAMCAAPYHARFDGSVYKIAAVLGAEMTMQTLGLHP